MKISIIQKITHFPLRGKVGHLRKKKRVLGCTIYSTVLLVYAARHGIRSMILQLPQVVVLYCTVRKNLPIHCPKYLKLFRDMLRREDAKMLYGAGGKRGPARIPSARDGNSIQISRPALVRAEYIIILQVEEQTTSPKSERGRVSGPPSKRQSEAGLRERGGHAWRVLVTYAMTNIIYDGPLTQAFNIKASSVWSPSK